MDGGGECAKTKTLAVFENVVTKERKKKRRRFRPHQFSDEESSPSESELVIDDELKYEASKRKKSGVRIRLKKEALNIICGWDDCSQGFSDAEGLFKHIMAHVEDTEDLECKWTDCPNPNDISSREILIRHVAYHGYLAKLVNIGENVLKRNSFPECSMERKYTIDIPKTYYVCEWQGCEHCRFSTVHEFLGHVECHVFAAPSGKKVDSSEVILCLWSGVCGGRFSTRYKLGDHIKVHSREKVIACPTCMSLFSTKTTFSDHRKRQLKTDMRSYQCSQCLKLFSVERLLSDHMRSHINQYKCTLCDMTSPKPSMLAKHYRYRHMDVRPFSCQICEKTFVTKSNLKSHLLTHRDNPYKCDQCEFGCKSKVGLRSHMIKVHGLETASYECEVCKARFKRGDYLTCHLIKFHKFHWPSGHCRFRYRKDTDGIHRLQTVRYESLEVTEEMIKSESMQSVKNPITPAYNFTFVKDAEGYKLTVLQNPGQQELGPVELYDPLKHKLGDSQNTEGRKIIITVEELDESGNVVQSKEFDSSQMVFCENDGTVRQKNEQPAGKRDMPLFETVYFETEGDDL